MGDDLKHAAASLLIVGFPGLMPDPAVLDLIQRGVGGTILFRRNIESPEQVMDLLNQLQDARLGDLPLIASVDQEGGTVARLKAPLTEFPDLACLGQTGDANLAEQLGAALAQELLPLGFNLNFAPVLDVNSNPHNPVIGVRALSADPERVARLGIAIIRGMQTHGLLACGKHFPGHGDTRTDSHFELPELPHGMDRLRRLELVPFRAAVAAGVATLMTAHIQFTAVDPLVPATLSRAVIQGLLRDELGFTGVVVSDDLEMKAIVDHFGVADAVVRGLDAGVDAFLVCHAASRQEEALEALVKAGESSSRGRSRLLQSAGRMRALRKGFLPYEKGVFSNVLPWLGAAAHRALAETIRARAAGLEAPA